MRRPGATIAASTAAIFAVVALSVVAAAPALAAAAAPDAPVPVIYSTDLYHPHQDPDDDFDLATLFSLPQLDVRGVILDGGRRQLKTPGSTPLRQMMAIAGHQVPFAIGLADPLKSLTDDGRGQAPEFQGGVDLILSVLRAAKRPVTLIQVGSLRDVAAAFNRAPDLMRAKLGRLYINSGNAAGRQTEYNVSLDPLAFRRVMQSGLPIYYCPCFGEVGKGSGDHPGGGYGTNWHFTQGPLFDRLSQPALAFFVYALAEIPTAIDPVAAVRQPGWLKLLDPAWRKATWGEGRNMWSTASLLIAAGRQIYRVAKGNYVALTPAAARGRGLRPADAVRAFWFERAKFHFDARGSLIRDADAAGSRTVIFRATDRDLYTAALTCALRHLLEGLGRAKAKAG